MSVPCFLLERTGRIELRLRRYATGDHNCPGQYGYHNAVSDVLAVGTEIFDPDEFPRDDPRWPTKCAECDREFLDTDMWQLFDHDLYRRTDTGEEMTLRDAPPGAMWDCEWLTDFSTFTGNDGHSYAVVLPNGRTWHIDSVASNCNFPDIPHKCWTRKGEAPMLTVDNSSAPPGHAGAGSIQSADWHGFLRNGQLVE